MSETIETVVQDAAQPAPEAAQDAPQQEQHIEARDEAEAPAAPQEPAPRQAGGDKRFAKMTARLAEENEARRRAEERAAAAEAMIRSMRGDDEADQGTYRPPPAQIDPNDPVVQQVATQVAHQRALNDRLNAINAAGHKEYGSDQWMEWAQFVANSGATANVAFVEALADAENAPALVRHFNENPDELSGILTKSPAGVGAALARLDTRYAAPKESAPKISRAASPAPRVGTAAAPAEPNIYDPKLSMREYAALRAKAAPVHLGGRGGR